MAPRTGIRYAGDSTALALAFHARHGFTHCPSFADCAPDPFSVFLTRTV